jgi:hypothetical protein
MPTKPPTDPPLAAWTPHDEQAFVASCQGLHRANQDRFGEVFTPPSLVATLLDALPSHVWTDPTRVWLDPAAGAGVFFLDVFRRLHRGLASWEPHASRRAQHIVRHQLFMVELNPVNVRRLRRAFGPHAHISQGDFTDPHTAWPAQVDVVVGNPPFQSDHGRDPTTGHRRSGGPKKLCADVLRHALSRWSPRGHLVCVLPHHFFSGDRSPFYSDLLACSHLDALHFLPVPSPEFPSIQQPMVWCVGHASDHASRSAPGPAPGTRIYTPGERPFSVVLRNRPVNPVRHWTVHTEALVEAWVGSTRNRASYVRGHPLSMYHGTRIPLIYSTTRALHTDDPALAPGWGHRKAVLLAVSATGACCMDYDGSWGAGPNTVWIPFDTVAEGRRLETFLRGPVYAALSQSTRTSRQFLKLTLVQYMQWDASSEPASSPAS